jgi:thioesterase domain-containing protein/acyl carrier protein
LNGARLVFVATDTALSPKALAAAIEAQAITTMFLTTSLFQHVARTVPNAFGRLRNLLFGGETADPQAVAAVLQSGRPPRRLLHVYGPTETTTFATWHHVTQVDPDAASIPIGRPLANTSVYILDRWQNPVPAGVIGELCIGGPGLAAGYLGEPQLTAARFIASPFRAGERLYRTGDLARYRMDGVIDFVGRVDRQVKIRGFRVELGEVENALKKHPGIRDALVVAQDVAAGDRRLNAYVVTTPDAKTELQPAMLRDFLRKALPGHMIPAGIRLLDSFPLTPNGKIDRDALPPIAANGQRQVDPGNLSILEHELLRLWQELLGTNEVGPDDNFFDLGGHSLLAVRLIDAVERVAGLRLPLTTLFARPTVKGLAAALLDGRKDYFRESIAAVQTAGDRPPFFFLHGEFNGGGFYSLRFARTLGSRQPFYACHPHGLTGRALPPSIEAMAEDYLPALRAIQPHGPYFLGGHCNGALVALEIGRRLHADSEDVALVMMIDATAYSSPVAPVAPQTENLLQPPENPDLLGYYREVMSRYIPESYDGTVTVLRSRETPWPQADLGWRNIAARVDVHEVPGDHMSALTKHLTALSETVRDCVEAAQRRAKARGARVPPS